MNMINLSIWQRCKVVAYERDPKSYDLIVQLVLESDNEMHGSCHLQGPWNQSRINVNVTISICAMWDCLINSYVVNGLHGMLVLFPDQLISSTSVVGSLFCQRKTVLLERFRGLDVGNKIMVIGTIIHQLFQIVLREKLHTLEDIEAAANDLISSRDILYSLYNNSLSLDNICTDIKGYIPHILNFVQRYLTPSRQAIPDGHFNEQIEYIEDIEENLWIPKLGLKGKIDVTVNIRSRNGLQPLELKTGRSTFSSEHRGQLVLYQMMMIESGFETDFGLLLYLKDCTMKEIKATRNEQRDLIMRRNELAYYFANDTNITNVQNIFELPEPINHPHACGNCPCNSICSVFLNEDNTINIQDTNPLKILSKKLTSHLTQPHVDYFLKWTKILEIERNGTDIQLKDLWCCSLDDLEKNERVILNMRLSADVKILQNGFLHTFQQGNEHSGDSHNCQVLTRSGFARNDYVVVCTNQRLAIATGNIESITDNTISIILERNLMMRYSGEVFYIYKYVTANSYSFNMSNIAALLVNRNECNVLRSIIIDKITPTFKIKLPKEIAISGIDALINLNQIQRYAAIKALTANEYFLLKGLPGTGKTETLSSIILLFAIMKKSIIITSHTHSAIDNILLRLIKRNVKFLRIGPITRIHKDILPYSESLLKNKYTSIGELHKFYSEYDIIAVTCFGSTHPLLSNRKFDVCLVDESTLLLQCTIIRPLLSARKFILVGDPDQLAPIVLTKMARCMGASESLFERLDSTLATNTLTIQYRMNKTITQLANSVTYGGKLICANKNIENATMFIPRRSMVESKYYEEKWLLKTISCNIELAAIFLNTGNVYDKNLKFHLDLHQMLSEPLNLDSYVKKFEWQSQYYNYCEIAIILHIVKILVEAGVESTCIGIIAPFRNQVVKLQNAFQFNNTVNNAENYKLQNIEINTVDQYQGRDKKIIIYSGTMSMKFTSTSTPELEDNILNDHRRLTVALTRSKEKLIIIGDENSLQNYAPFNLLFQHLNGIRQLNLKDGELGFSWIKYLINLKHTWNF